MALLAARRACEAAGLTTLDWVADALTALAESRPLPPPFDDDALMWQTLATDPHVPDRTVGRAVPPERPPFRPSLSPGDRGLHPQEVAQAVVGPAAAVARAAAAEAESPTTTANPQASDSAPYTVMISFGPPDPSLRVSQPHAALPAITGAAESDPLQAALDAVFAAVVTYGEDHPALLAEVWSEVEGRRS